MDSTLAECGIPRLPSQREHVLDDIAPLVGVLCEAPERWLHRAFLLVSSDGGCLSETITKVRALDRQTLEMVEISHEFCRFEYRDSAFKREPERYIVLSVMFALREGAAPKVSYAELERAFEDGPRTLASVRDAVIAFRL